jgi:hypothetical protein
MVNIPSIYENLGNGFRCFFVVKIKTHRFLDPFWMLIVGIVGLVDQ